MWLTVGTGDRWFVGAFVSRKACSAVLALGTSRHSESPGVWRCFFLFRRPLIWEAWCPWRGTLGSRPSDTLKSYLGPQGALVYVGSIYWYLPKKKLELKLKKKFT